jgi:hypothetical protein
LINAGKCERNEQRETGLVHIAEAGVAADTSYCSATLRESRRELLKLECLTSFSSSRIPVTLMAVAILYKNELRVTFGKTTRC